MPLELSAQILALSRQSNDNLIIVMILFVIKNASNDNNHLRLGVMFSSYYKTI